MLLVYIGRIGSRTDVPPVRPQPHHHHVHIYSPLEEFNTNIETRVDEVIRCGVREFLI